MTNKYTNGPWNILGYDEIEGLPVIEICAGLIGSKSFVNVAYVNGHINDGITTATKANAQLIAAAPELLEALNNCIKTLSDDRIGSSLYMEGSQIYSDFEAAIKQAKIAINKAEGK